MQNLSLLCLVVSYKCSCCVLQCLTAERPFFGRSLSPKILQMNSEKRVCEGNIVFDADLF